MIPSVVSGGYEMHTQTRRVLTINRLQRAYSRRTYNRYVRVPGDCCIPVSLLFLYLYWWRGLLACWARFFLGGGDERADGQTDRQTLFVGGASWRGGDHYGRRRRGEWVGEWVGRWVLIVAVGPGSLACVRERAGGGMHPPLSQFFD